MVGTYIFKGMSCKAALANGTRLTTHRRDYHYETGTRICGGEFGCVYEALKSNGEQCAIKIFKGRKPQSDYEHEKGVLDDLRIYSLCCPLPYLAKCLDAFQDDRSGLFCIIMPRYSMSLAGVLKDKRCPDNSKLSIAHINAWAYHTAEGLKALHSDDLGWIHADLEPKNILLEVDGTGSMPRAVLADFGVALKIDKDKKVVNMKRMPHMWRGIHLPSNPPETRKLLNALSMLSDDQAEMLAHEIVVSTKIDVWSWGYCMLCLLTGKDELTEKDVDEKAVLPLEKGERVRAIVEVAEDYGTAYNPEWSKLYEAVAKAFTYGAIDRPTAAELVELLQPTATAASLIPVVKTEAVGGAVADVPASPACSSPVATKGFSEAKSFDALPNDIRTGPPALKLSAPRVLDIPALPSTCSVREDLLQQVKERLLANLSSTGSRTVAIAAGHSSQAASLQGMPGAAKTVLRTTH